MTKSKRRKEQKQPQDQRFLPLLRAECVFFNFLYSGEDYFLHKLGQVPEPKHPLCEYLPYGVYLEHPKSFPTSIE